MTDIDENLLTVAKLREQIDPDGDLDGDDQIKDNVHTYDHRPVLNFLDDYAADSDRPESSFADTDLGSIVHSNLKTNAASRAVLDGDYGLSSYLVGVTEQDLDASNISLPSRILSRLDADGNLATMLAAGAPNSGKTNTVWLCCEIAKAWWNDLLVLSNARADIVDHRVTSAHDLTVSLLENRDVPKAVVIDEGSTHFDARTQSYQVANQWSPLLKRMAKLGVEFVAVIGHTGKDVDPEMKRLTNMALYKTAPKSAEFFAEWPADSDFPSDRLFGGSLEELEPTSVEYDPDEPAPWSWDLRAGLFAEDLSWGRLLDLLRESGPDTG